MSRIVIIGSGFGSCTAVRTLRKEGFDGEITVVAPRAELFYFPSLIWVPAGKRSYDDLVYSLDEFYREHRVDFHAGMVESLDAAAQRISTDNGEIDYDVLIIASGGRYIRKLPGIENAHIACSGWEATKAFSDALARMDGGTVAFGFAGNPKEPSAMRGGPVFEFLFGVDTLLRQQGRRDKFTLKFFSPAPRPGKRMGEKAVDRLLADMKKRGIDTHLGNKMKRFNEDSIETEAETFPADLILFVPGMTGPAWAANSGLQLSEGGFFKADQFCQAEGSKGIYLAGDAGSFPGPDWKPKQAHMADLQAEAAVKNALDYLEHKPASHTFKTELLCIVDTLSSASMVYRGKKSLMMKFPLFHWLKVFFEKWYLRPYCR